MEAHAPVPARGPVTGPAGPGEADDGFSRMQALAAIVESAADAATAITTDGTYVAWNPAAERLFGWRADEVLGRNIFDVWPEDRHRFIRADYEVVLAGGVAGPLDAAIPARDGTVRELSLVSTPVRDAEGRVRAVAMIARDVSEDRRRERERLDLEARLRQAQKMEAIGRLAGGVAHDFNNLLAAITGYASLLRDEVNGPARDDVEQILHAAARAADLTRRLLAFSREVPIDPRPVALDDVLTDAARLVGRLVPERISFRVDAASGARVVADVVDVEQVILNLVVNAVDAIENQGSIVVASRLVHHPGGIAAELSVSDTGHGMDGETIGRIYEPFFTTKPIGQGTGLGLATVYAIVRRCGGTVAVESAVDRGTTFTVRLPAQLGPPDGRAEHPQLRDEGLRGHVLVVEDEDAVRDLTGRVLERAGFTVESFGDPAAVLERGLAGVDLVVTDVVMPGMSGPEMLERLGGDVPAILVSGYEGDHAVPERRPLVRKPYSPDELVAAAARVLRDASGSS